MGRGRADAGGDVPVLRGVEQVQGVRRREQGVLFREKGREIGIVGLLRQESGVEVDRWHSAARGRFL